MLRTCGAAILAASLMVSNAFAAEQLAKAPLAPGKAAGVKQAQLLGNNALLLLIGVGVVIGGIVLVTTGSSDGTTTTTTTTGAP